MHGRLASAFWSFQLVHQVLSANFVSMQGTTMRKRCLTDEQRSDAVSAALSPFIALFSEPPGQFCSTRSVLPPLRSANAPPAPTSPWFPCFMTLPLLLILLAWTAASASSASHGRLMLRIISRTRLGFVVVSVSRVTTSHDLRPPVLLRTCVPACLRPDLFLYRLMITPLNLTEVVQELFRAYCGRTYMRALTVSADRCQLVGP